MPADLVRRDASGANLVLQPAHRRRQAGRDDLLKTMPTDHVVLTTRAIVLADEGRFMLNLS